MKRTIKQEVLIRVALVFLAVIISGVVTVTSLNASRSYKGYGTVGGHSCTGIDRTEGSLRLG